jgi:hypothetical protein
MATGIRSLAARYLYEVQSRSHDIQYFHGRISLHFGHHSQRLENHNNAIRSWNPVDGPIVIAGRNRSASGDDGKFQTCGCR